MPVLSLIPTTPAQWLLVSPLALVTGLHLLTLTSHLVDFATMPRLERFVPEDPGGLSETIRLDIVIPARNEGSKIGRCLESLTRQTFTNFTVWLVNDRSTDNTQAVMEAYADRDPRFHILQGAEPPEGWVGKVNAIAQALPHLSAPFLLFLDADTWLDENNLAAALTLMQQKNLDLMSLLPTLESVTFWERVILPCAAYIISLRFPGYGVNNPKLPDIAIANGQYLLFSADGYQKLGTHAVVKHSLVEDLDIARRAKKLGLRFNLVSALDFFKVRMYTSFAELREGWTKNMYFADQLRNVIFAGLSAAMMCNPMLPLLMAAMGLFIPLPPVVWGWVALSWVALTLSNMVYRGFMRMYPLYALTYPFGMGIMAWFYWESRCLALSSQGVVWKGRRYRAQ